MVGGGGGGTIGSEGILPPHMKDAGGGGGSKGNGTDPCPEEGGRGKRGGGRVCSQLKLGTGGGVIGGRRVLLGAGNKVEGGGGGITGGSVVSPSKLNVGSGGGSGIGGNVGFVLSSKISSYKVKMLAGIER